MMRHSKHTLAILSGLLCCLAAVPAAASLGGDPSSVVADAQAFGAMSVQQQAGTLQRYEIRTAGSVIHEYVDATGVVYAIVFSGGPTPNLDQLLGTHLAAFRAGLRHDLRTAIVNTPTLQAQIHGRPGAISGVIWLPAQLPPGISTGALQ
ncbi:MAG: DUF2844 domain-containing protein [Pseudomonadota bacterium]|nr:DUF2844 domain-containing protein [Pseudomonadota bacterium]